MTIDEAIRCLCVHSSTNGSGLCTDKQHYEAKQMAIQALEQEPCEDAISRQAVLDMLEDINAETEGVGFYYEHYVDYIKSLPSVKPQESCDVPDTNDGKMSESPTDSKDVIWYSKRNYSEIVVEPQERSE